MGATVLLAAASSAVLAQAQPFAVCLKRTGSSTCDSNDTTATHMSIEPASGRLTLEGVEGLGSGLPGGASGLGNIAFSVNSSVNPVTLPSSGSSAVVVLQNIPAGASCTMRAITTVSGSGNVGGDGWTDGGSLCTSCGTEAPPRTLILNSSPLGWTLKLNAQCSIQTQDGYAVSGPIKSSELITVPPAEIPLGDCPYVDGNGNDAVPPGHDGLTLASRQSVVTVTANGPTGVGPYDGLLYTSMYRVHTGGNVVGGRLLASPGSSAQGYGWPGTWYNNMTYSITSGKFIALKLRAPSDPSWKGISFNLRTYSPEGLNNTAVSWSIAPCPGQFRSVVPGQLGVPVGSSEITLPSACKMNVSSTKGTGIYAIVSDPAAPYTSTGFGSKCPITMGKTYYLNIMAVDASQPGHLDPANALQNSWCPGSACLMRNGSAGLVLDPNYN